MDTYAFTIVTFSISAMCFGIGVWLGYKASELRYQRRKAKEAKK